MVKSEIFKRLKASDGGIDRISNLPETLLSHILSLLPTKSVVATSVLSTRWKFLWTSIVNLDLDLDERAFLWDKEPKLKRNKFIQFVNRVLLLLNLPSIQKFRLSCVCEQEHFDTSSINSWISTAFQRTIQELDITLMLQNDFVLPLRDMYCNVKVLKLEGYIHFSIPATASIYFPSLHTLCLYMLTFEIASDSSVSFPSLKNLRLDCVECADEDSIHRLFSCCPVLEDLFIERNDYDSILCLTIRIPSLKSLTLHFNGFSYDRAHTLEIDTPALLYLDLVDELTYLAAENLSSLVQANVKLTTFIEGDDVNVDICVNISNFIRSLSKVKIMSVLGHALTAFRRTASATISPGFYNLTRLELELYECLDLAVIINKFLENMDNLEHLVMKGWIDACSHRSWWTEPLSMPNCLLSRVTTISFGCMTAHCCDQLEMLRYFLKNAEVLQFMTISTRLMSEKEQFNLLKKISMFPRGSRTCQVDFT